MSTFKQFKNLIRDLIVWKLTWKVTRRNYHGWPVERMHRLTGRVQHKRYDVDGRWKPGPLVRPHPISYL